MLVKRMLLVPMALLSACTGVMEGESGPEKATGNVNGLWISSSELAQLSTSGPAWAQLKDAADRAAAIPNLSDQNDPTNARVLAKALVFARTGIEKYRAEVIIALAAAIDTENGGRTLSLGRELVAYVIAADLVDFAHIDPARERRFRAWLREVRNEKLDGMTLIKRIMSTRRCKGR